MPRIVCLSDTHNYQDEIAVPNGDILLLEKGGGRSGHWTRGLSPGESSSPHDD